MAIALKAIPNKRPRWFKGKVDNLHPRLLVNCLMFLTLPTGTNSDLLKFTFKLEATSR